MDATPLTEQQQELVVKWRFLSPYCWNKYGRRSDIVSRLGKYDAISAGFIGLCRAARTYREGHTSKAKFRTYAVKCIKREMLDSARSEALPVRIPRYGFNASRNDTFIGIARDKLLMTTTNAVEGVAQRYSLDDGIRELLDRLVNELPDDMRTVLRLIYDEDVDRTNAGRAMGITPYTVKKLEQEALAVLRDMLEKSCVRFVEPM